MFDSGIIELCRQKLMKKKGIIYVILLITIISASLGGICKSIERCRTEIDVVRYEVAGATDTATRIVQLTDLHSWEFGEGNQKLIDLVAAQEPDLILMTGDMMDRSDMDADVVCALIEELAAVAPVYYGYGNHEYQWMSNHGESLTPVLTEAGAVVLDVEYLDITVNGQDLRIGGYHGYYRQPGMYDISPERHQAEMAFCDDFEDTDRYKILLSHIPTAWIDWGYMNEFPVDLVLSGHYHGGQIVLPWLGGIYAPYIGLFPPYTEGVFEGAEATCILSTGLGSSPGIPRINNLPEIVVVELGGNN